MLTFTPFESGFGSYVLGAGPAASPDERTVAELRAALDEYLLLVFRAGACSVTAEQVVAFCSALGPLRPSLADRSRMDGHPEINLVGNGQLGHATASGGNGPLHYHSDLHHEPPLIEFVYLDALSVPGSGGATKWVNLQTAYDALSDEKKSQIDGLVVHYSLREDLDRGTYFKASAETLATRRKSNSVGLVQTNPRTGRKSVWPNVGPQSNHAAQIVDMEPESSAALLAELYEHCTQDRFSVRYHWQAGDVCIWNNIQTLHGREGWDGTTERLMRHLNILGYRDPHQQD